MKIFYSLILIFSLGCMTYHMPIPKDQPSNESIEAFKNKFLGKEGMIRFSMSDYSSMGKSFYKIPRGEKIKITNITYDERLRFINIEVTDDLGRKDTYYVMYNPNYNLPSFDDQLYNYINFGDEKSVKVDALYDSLNNKIYWVSPKINTVEPEFKIKPFEKVKILKAYADFNQFNQSLSYPPSYAITLIIVKSIESGIIDTLHFQTYTNTNKKPIQQWENFLKNRLSDVPIQKPTVQSYISDNKIENKNYIEKDEADIILGEDGKYKIIYKEFSPKDELNNTLIYTVSLSTYMLKKELGENVHDIFIDSKNVYYYHKENPKIKYFEKQGIKVGEFFQTIDYSLHWPASIKNNFNIYFNKFRKNKYICLNNIGVDAIYNDLRLSLQDQCKKITTDYSINLLKNMYNYFNMLNEIDGFILTISWASKSFSDDLPIYTNHSLCYISSKDQISKLSNYEYTLQQFLNSILILNKNGVSGSENRININVE